MVAKRYLNISRQLRRMESTSRSTIFSGFGELLEGIVTIRAFSAEHRFMEEFHKKNDVAIKVRLHIYEGSYDTDAVLYRCTTIPGWPTNGFSSILMFLGLLQY